MKDLYEICKCIRSSTKVMFLKKKRHFSNLFFFWDLYETSLSHYETCLGRAQGKWHPKQGRWLYVRPPRQHLWVGPRGDGDASPRSIVSTWMIGLDGWPGILPIFFFFGGGLGIWPGDFC